MQKDSCSRGAVNKRTRAGLQEKVRQSFAFPPCTESLPPFWRGGIVLYNRLTRFKMAFFEHLVSYLYTRKAISAPHIMFVPKFEDFGKFLDVCYEQLNTPITRTTKLELDGVEVFVWFPFVVERFS